MIEIGKTYAFTGNPPSRRGRKALVLSKNGNLHRVRWANGLEAIVFATDLGDPVEPAVPGVDEFCLICAGNRQVKICESDPERDWVEVAIGSESCPNCCIRG